MLLLQKQIPLLAYVGGLQGPTQSGFKQYLPPLLLLIKQPNITSHYDGQRIGTRMPTLVGKRSC